MKYVIAGTLGFVTWLLGVLAPPLQGTGLHTLLVAFGWVLVPAAFTWVVVLWTKQ